MSRPVIEPWSPRSLSNILFIRPMLYHHRIIVLNVRESYKKGAFVFWPVLFFVQLCYYVHRLFYSKNIVCFIQRISFVLFKEYRFIQRISFVLFKEYVDRLWTELMPGYIFVEPSWCHSKMLKLQQEYLYQKSRTDIMFTMTVNTIPESYIVTVRFQ